MFVALANKRSDLWWPWTAPFIQHNTLLIAKTNLLARPFVINASTHLAPNNIESASTCNTLKISWLPTGDSNRNCVDTVNNQFNFNIVVGYFKKPSIECPKDDNNYCCFKDKNDQIIDYNNSQRTLRTIAVFAQIHAFFALQWKGMTRVSIWVSFGSHKIGRNHLRRGGFNLAKRALHPTKLPSMRLLCALIWLLFESNGISIINLIWKPSLQFAYLWIIARTEFVALKRSGQQCLKLSRDLLWFVERSFAHNVCNFSLVASRKRRWTENEDGCKMDGFLLQTRSSCIWSALYCFFAAHTFFPSHTLGTSASCNHVIRTLWVCNNSPLIASPTNVSLFICQFDGHARTCGIFWPRFWLIPTRSTNHRVNEAAANQTTFIHSKTSCHEWIELFCEGR